MPVQTLTGFVHRLTVAGDSDAVVAVAFSTDGKRIVSGSADKTAKVWERK